jgi:iron complex outermembrane receptor protein
MKPSLSTTRLPAVGGYGVHGVRSRQKLLALVITGALLPTAESFAQSGLALEEVVVTARKREESVQDVPIAISSFTAEALEQQGALNITGVAFHTPNMIYTPSLGNSTATRVSIRGQTQNDIIGTLDSSIGTYVDDVIWARPVGSKMNLADIERIEVLRGP